VRAAPVRYRGVFTRSLDLVELLAIFRRRFRLFAAIVVLITVAAVVSTLLLKPAYTASVEVKIDPNQRTSVDTPRAGQSTDATNSFVDTEIQLARSRKVAAAVIQRLNLMSDPEFSEAAAAAAKGAAPGDPRPLSALALEKVVDGVLGGFNVARNGATYIVNFTFTSEDPGKAALIANTFADEYIVASARLRMETMQATAEALQSGLNRLESQAKSADQAAASYRAATGLVSAGSGSTITQQQASTIASQLGAAEADLATARSNLAAARQQIQTGGTDSVSSVLGSPVIQDLRRQRAEVLRKQVEIANRYGPRHPSFVQVQEELEGLDRQISDESQRILAALQAAVTAGDTRVGALRASLGQLQGQLAASSRAEATAQSLEREAEAKQNIYNQYNLAQQQANQQKNFNDPQGVVVSRATPPDAPSFPNKPLFAGLGAVLGLIIGACAVLVAEAFDSGLLSGQDVEDVLDQPFIGAIPLLSSRTLRRAGKTISPENYVIAKPMSAFAEAFRALRSALVHANVDQPPKVVAVTSALPGEGKTAATLAFGRVLGMGGHKVIILDCDLRRSSLGRLTRVARAEGLVEVLAGEATIEQAVVPDEVENVFLLPLSKASFTPRDLFGTQAFAQLVEKLRESYDFVVLDTPPVLAVADSRAIARQADNVIFLCRWSRTPRAASNAALNLLEQDGAHVAGVALNMVDLSSRSALSTGDSSYYYADYRRYYEG
jgi:capsular exopolysaccharide synthesis family protein